MLQMLLSTLSEHRLMTSVEKCGSCLRYESFFHMACVTICASSMAARPGDRKPLLLSTSTHACIRRMALLRISSVSDCSSADSCIRDMCACSRRLVLTWGSLYLAPGCSLFGNRCANWNMYTTQRCNALFTAIYSSWSDSSISLLAYFSGVKHTGLLKWDFYMLNAIW